MSKLHVHNASCPTYAFYTILIISFILTCMYIIESDVVLISKMLCFIFLLHTTTHVLVVVQCKPASLGIGTWCAHQDPPHPSLFFCDSKATIESTI